MPYIPTVWVDEVPAESPVKYQITDEGAGLSSIQIQTPVFPGTPMNAANLNKIEAGISTAQAAVEAAQLDIEVNAESIQSSANNILKTYGNGGDGDVVISGVVALTRNMFYRNLTISATGELKTSGWIIKVSETLTIDVGGKITANGENGLPALAGYYYGQVAGAGSWSNMPLGITPLPSGSAGGASSGGGDSTNNNALGGLGGTVLGVPPMFPFLLYAGSGGGGGGGHGYPTTSAVGRVGETLRVAGYTGGTGGDASGSAASTPVSGGSGGGGGGCMHIYSRTLNNLGSISAVGGQGGACRSIQPRAGGGGGGGGGMILIIYSSLTGLGFGTLNVSGGAGGVGGTATSAHGTAGTNGYTLTYQIKA